MIKTFRELVKNIDMVLFNEFPKVCDDYELEYWKDCNEEYDEDIDIYQWFVISPNNA